MVLVVRYGKARRNRMHTSHLRHLYLPTEIVARHPDGTISREEAKSGMCE